VGAGAAFGQQDAARRAAAAAIKAIFICGSKGFDFDNRYETHTSLAVETSGELSRCKAKDAAKIPEFLHDGEAGISNHEWLRTFAWRLASSGLVAVIACC
jgi:hypothetical protein